MQKQKLRIAILSRKLNYSTLRLKQEAECQGHEVMLIDVLQCYMGITSQGPSLHCGETQIKGYDAVIPRIGVSSNFYGLAVLRQLEMQGIYALNSSISIARSRDKLRCFQMLSNRNIGLPVTCFAHSRHRISDLMDMVGGAPLIVKSIEGTQGLGVVLAETKKAARSVIEGLMDASAQIIIQEYIQESEGSDIRCLVVGGHVVAAMKRQSHKEDFRSNLHRGGTATPISITQEERRMAVRAARIMGLRVAGVDLIRSHRGPLVMEVNSSPGLKGIEQACEMNVAAQIINMIETTYCKKNKKTNII